MNPSSTTDQHVCIVPRDLNVLVPQQLVQWPRHRLSSSSPLRESRGPRRSPLLGCRRDTALFLHCPFSLQNLHAGSPVSVRRKWATKSRRAMMGSPRRGNSSQSPDGFRFVGGPDKGAITVPLPAEVKGHDAVLRPDSIPLSQGSGEQGGKVPLMGLKEGLTTVPCGRSCGQREC